MENPTITLAENYVQEIGEDGPFTSQRFNVEAVYPDGRRFHHFKAYRSIDDAAALAGRIERAVFNGECNPADSEYWNRGFDVYGSEAYQRNGGEHELQKADVEAEYGPGTYQPGGPGYLHRA